MTSPLDEIPPDERRRLIELGNDVMLEVGTLAAAGQYDEAVERIAGLSHVETFVSFCTYMGATARVLDVIAERLGGSASDLWEQWAMEIQRIRYGPT